MNTNVFSSTHSPLLKGPGFDPNSLKEDYSPVDCDFTDELELVSMKKIKVQITYWNESKSTETKTDIITDIFTDGKEEFVKLSDESLIRLDRIAELKMIS